MKTSIWAGETNCVWIRSAMSLQLSLILRNWKILHTSALCCLCLRTAFSAHVTPLLRLSLSTNLYDKPLTEASAPPTYPACDRTLHFHNKWCGWGEEKNIMGERKTKCENRGRGRVSWDGLCTFHSYFPSTSSSALLSSVLATSASTLCLCSLFCLPVILSDELYEQC